jgi:hypothetical protein
MRALPARHLAAPALCAALLLGTAGPAAVAADGRSAPGPSEAGPAASGHDQAQVPVPDADRLLGQVRSLSAAGGVLTPVTDLLDATLKADNGQLPPSRAAGLGRVAEAAIREAAAAPSTLVRPAKALVTPTAPAAAASPAKPADPAKPMRPAKPATPSAVASPSASASAASASAGPSPAAPGASRKPATPAAPPLSKTAARGTTRGHGDRAADADTLQDALTALQKAVDALVEASTSGDVGQVVPAVSTVVNDLVGVLLGTLTDPTLTDPALADTASTDPASADLALIGPGLAGLLPSVSGLVAGVLPLAPLTSALTSLTPASTSPAPALPSLPNDLILPTS